MNTYEHSSSRDEHRGDLWIQKQEHITEHIPARRKHKIKKVSDDL